MNFPGGYLNALPCFAEATAVCTVCAICRRNVAKAPAVRIAEKNWSFLIHKDNFITIPLTAPKQERFSSSPGKSTPQRKNQRILSQIKDLFAFSNL
jgi:hypothetical protein